MRGKLILAMGMATLVVLSSFAAECLAGPPSSLGATVSMSKNSYVYGEPITATIQVTNEVSGRVMNAGFANTVFYKELRIIDPLGRLVPPLRSTQWQGEFPDTPDNNPDPGPVLMMERSDGSVVQAVPYETVQTTPVVQTADLRQYYPIDLPGEYSVQLTVSAMIFKPGDEGNINNMEWSGLLQSDTVYFSVQGGTRIQVSPASWPMSWKNALPSLYFSVVIWPASGQNITDYTLASIRLNGLAPRRVVRMSSSAGPYILAYFGKQEAINSLGSVQAGNQCTVYLLGRLNSDLPFGGATQVTITP